ncbi:hypothetical protein DsansV1_C24g0180821 [Dioscorea sansibarensis]
MFPIRFLPINSWMFCFFAHLLSLFLLALFLLKFAKSELKPF